MKQYIPIIIFILGIAALTTAPILTALLEKTEDGMDKDTHSSIVSQSAIESDGRMTLEGKTIVVDAGHGGADPGKVSVNGTLEKDVNLAVALLLEQELSQRGAIVVMTRTDDHSPGDGGKQSDLRARAECIAGAAPDIAVSIHQNSFTQESSHGAQVFYYTTSEEGQTLAQILQEVLIEKADPENRRGAKANDSYYILKKSQCPTVIVECGFLSNSAEAQKLCTDDYQKLLAQSIADGVEKYFM